MKKLFGLIALLAAANVVAAPAVTLTSDRTTGISPTSITLTWTSTEVDACTASGDWSGDKPASGTETFYGVQDSKTFTLTCSAATGQATASWTAPTKNTDGTPLTNLAGYKLYHAPSAGAVNAATPIALPATTTSHVITGLPAGARHYGVRAFNSNGVDSNMSDLATNTIVLPSTSASVSVTIEKMPDMPTGLTVQSPTARLLLRGDVSGLKAGNVPVGTPCGKQEDGNWHRVDRKDVKLDFWGRVFRNSPIVARCAA